MLGGLTETPLRHVAKSMRRVRVAPIASGCREVLGVRVAHANQVYRAIGQVGEADRDGERAPVLVGTVEGNEDCGGHWSLVHRERAIRNQSGWAPSTKNRSTTAGSKLCRVVRFMELILAHALLLQGIRARVVGHALTQRTRLADRQRTLAARSCL